VKNTLRPIGFGFLGFGPSLGFPTPRPINLGLVVGIFPLRFIRVDS